MTLENLKFQGLTWLLIAGIIAMWAVASTPPCYASKKVLRIAMFSNDPVGIDVLSQAFSPDGYSVLAQISEPLLYPDVNGELQGAISESWKQISPTQWEFRIRKGIRFQNGEECDGFTIKYSIETVLDPKIDSAFSQPLKTIQSVSVDPKDPFTVRIETSFPDGMLLYRLAFANIIPPKYIEQVGINGFHQHPLGTGPFRFVSWSPKKEIVLDRNPYYWRKGYPKVDRIVYVILPPEKWIQALNTGQVDVVPFLDGRHIREMVKNADLRVMKRKCLYTTVIMLHNRGPLRYKEVRQALNYALNKRDIVKYADYGNSIPVASLGLEGSIGRNETLAPYSYDIVKARELLEKTPYARGFHLKVLTGDTSKALAKIMKAQYGKLNVSLDLEVVPRTDLTEKVMIYQVRNNLSRPDYDLVLYPVDNPLIDLAFTGDWGYLSRSPWSLLRSKAYDEKYMWALKAHSFDEHVRRLKDLDRFFHDEAFSIFTTQRILTVVFRKGVKLPLPISGGFYFDTFKQVEIDLDPE